MVIARARLTLVLMASALLASMSGCVRPKPENKVTRLGDDVLAIGSAPGIIYDSIPGDAIMAGGEVTFTGSAGGDYVGAGGRQEIGGRVHGSLRATGGHVEVKGTVDRNLTIGAGALVVDSTAVIGHNAYLIGGSIGVDGTVRGGVLATGGDVTLNGAVGGDVEISSDAFSLGPRAQIAGNLRYRVPKDKVHIDRAARVTGTITALPISRGWGLWHWLWTLGGFLAGAVVVFLLPRFTAEATEFLRRRPIRAAVVAIVAGILIPIAIVIGAITAIGLPLALFTAAVFAVFGGMSEIPVAVWLGEQILHNRTPLGRQSAIVNFFLGALVLILVSIIPVLGDIVTFVAGCLGFGAILLTAWAARKRQLV
jgi:hypothetical protein